MKGLLSAFFLMLFVLGCESIPFRIEPPVNLANPDPVSVRRAFEDASAGHFRLINTIVFEYNFNSFSGIGFVDVDAVEKRFALSCINHVGIKLFELSFDKNVINTIFALPEFNSRGNFSEAVGEDIKRIYFDLLPSADAVSEVGKSSVIFRQTAGKGVYEYVFSGPAHHLTEKIYYEEGSPVWRVSFYEYVMRNGKAYPGGTILKNYLYGYRLIVRLKEIVD